MEPAEQLSRILPTLCEMVDRIDPLQLHHATPCSAFTVHDVLDHMIVGAGTFAPLFRGEPPPSCGAPAVYGRVPAAEFRAAMDELLDAVRSPGALERTISAPIGELPGSTFARFVAFDGLIHGWDLARSTGLDYRLPPEVIAAVDAFARGALTPDLRDGDTFKEVTAAPADAGPLDCLAAFSGRSL